MANGKQGITIFTTQNWVRRLLTLVSVIAGAIIALGHAPENVVEWCGLVVAAVGSLLTDLKSG